MNDVVTARDEAVKEKENSNLQAQNDESDKAQVDTSPSVKVAAKPSQVMKDKELNVSSPTQDQTNAETTSAKNVALGIDTKARASRRRRRRAR